MGLDPPPSHSRFLPSVSMTLFERHIVRRLLKRFFFFIGALIVFFIVLHWVEYSDDFLDGGATAAEVFRVFYPSYIPEIVRLTSPLALFLSCIYVTSTLAQELQLIALQTTGVSLYRLMRPYVLVGVGVTVFMFGFNGWVVPRTNEVVVQYETEYLPHGNDAPLNVNELQRRNSPGTILSVGYYDRDRKRAHDVSLQTFEKSTRLVSRLDAERMEWVDSLRTWQMEDIVRRTFVADSMVETKTARLDTTLHIYPRDLARSQTDVAAMTIPVARNYLLALQRAGAGNLERPLVAYYNKFAYPFANLILVLIGVPLASVRRRGGQAIQFAIGLLTAFVYLSLQKLTEPFGYAGALPPALTTWLPHLTFALVAVIVLWYTRK